MRFIKLFEQFISEKNKSISYYKEHPEAIKTFGISGKDEADFDDYMKRSYDGENPVKIKMSDLDKKLENKFKKEASEIKVKTNDDSRSNNMWYKIQYEDDMFSKYYLENNPSKKTMFDNASKGRFTQSDNTLTPEAIEFLDKNWEDIVSVMNQKKKLLNISMNWTDKRIEKEATMKGVSKKDYVAALSWIKYFTSMSRRKLPKEIWPALKAVTVEESELPKVLYRGLFFDGAKIKNQDEFMKKWAEGSKPGVSLLKASSWSSSKAVATSFMTEQDFIKDKENGYFVLLKWNVDPKHVIADLRNVNGEFWNQQEIIVDSDVKDYEVAKLIKYEPYDKDENREIDKFKKSNQASNTGFFGRTKHDVMSDIFNLFDADVQEQYKMEWKEMKDLTLGEVEKRMKLKYAGEWDGIDDRKFLFSMMAGLKRFSWNLPYKIYPVKYVSPTKAEVKLSIECDIKSYYILKDLILDNLGIDKTNKKLNDVPELDLPYGFSIEGDGTVELVQNSILLFKFDVALPKKYEQEISDKSNREPTDVQQSNIDRIVKIVNDNIDEVNRILIKHAKERFEQKNVKVNMR